MEFSYVVLIYFSYESRYFVKCDTLAEAETKAKHYANTGAREVIICKIEDIDYVETY